VSEKSQPYIIKIPPFHYLHVLNNNTNVSRLETGPQKFVIFDNDSVVLGPKKMIVIPPRHYCILENPVVRNEKNEVLLDQYGQVRLRHGEEEIRFEQNDPFPLYPGESVQGDIKPLLVVQPFSALRLRAKRDFKDRYANNIQRKAGDEWIFEGANTYYPQVEVSIIETIAAIVIEPGQALKLRARCNTKDNNNKPKLAGEEWLIREAGPYLPRVDEVVVAKVTAIALSEKQALRLKATNNFTDMYGNARHTGDEWLITLQNAQTHIPDVSEDVIGLEPLIFLTPRQFCVVNNPVENGRPLLGAKKLIRGETSFFLKPPYETLDNKRIQDVYVLGAEEALLLKANEAFIDSFDGSKKIKRKPGETWLFYGPGEYWPPLEVDVIKMQKAFLHVEALNIQYFQPVPFALCIVALLIALYIMNAYRP